MFAELPHPHEPTPRAVLKDRVIDPGTDPVEWATLGLRGAPGFDDREQLLCLTHAECVALMARLMVSAPASTEAHRVATLFGYPAAHVLFEPGDARRASASDPAAAGHQDLSTTQRYMHVSPEESTTLLASCSPNRTAARPRARYVRCIMPLPALAKRAGAGAASARAYSGARRARPSAPRTAPHTTSPGGEYRLLR